MNFFRKKRVIDSTVPDFENSKVARKEVVRIFNKVQKRFPYRWNIDGNERLNKFMKRTSLWLPDLEFKIASGVSSDLWEIFSKTLLNQKNPGEYSQSMMIKLFHNYVSYLGGLSEEYAGTQAEREEFADCLGHGMYLILQEGSEVLAQPFIFRLTAVWIHSRRRLKPS